MDTPPSRSPGDLIAGKYRLESPLGAGGQAMVWEAHNLALDARVAIKLVHPDLSERGQAERLLREARAVAQLRHPAVVRVFDVARTDDGDWFIVMELLEGECLADKLSDGRRLAPTEAVRLLLPVAEALVAAHAAGIVHRDVKPDNIVLSRAGKHLQPKLLDFGIAKLRRDADWRRTTAKGELMGTPAYLSPEQVECGGDVDHRSDIWSFAVTVYECVTGCLPFEGELEHDLLASILTREPRSILSHSAGDAELWRLLAGGLKKARAERCQSMQMLGKGLAHWLLAQGVTEDACGVSLEATWLGATLPPGRVTPHATTQRTRSPTPSVARWTALSAGAAVVALLAAAFLLARPAPAGEHPQAAPPIAATPRLVPQVVPVDTPPLVVAPGAPLPTATADAHDGPATLAARDAKKTTQRAHAAAPATPTPAPRADSTPDGLRLMNPY